MFLITILEYGNLAAIHAGRVTIMKKDIQLVMRIKEVTSGYKTVDEVTGKKAREKQRLAALDDQNRQKQLLGLQWQKRCRTEPQPSTSNPQPSTSRDTSHGQSSDSNDSDNCSDGHSDNGSDGDSDFNLSRKGPRKSRKIIVQEDSSDEEVQRSNGKGRKRPLVSSEDEVPRKNKGRGKKSKQSSTEIPKNKKGSSKKSEDSSSDEEVPKKENGKR